MNAQNMYATPCRLWSSIASITTNLETCKHALKQRAYFIEFALNIISLYHYDHGVSDQARILRKTARTCRGASTAGWRRRRAGAMQAAPGAAQWRLTSVPFKFQHSSHSNSWGHARFFSCLAPRISCGHLHVPTHAASLPISTHCYNTAGGVCDDAARASSNLQCVMTSDV